MGRKNEYVNKAGQLIGNKIADLRLSLGLSREQLASMIDVTHQQLQKYEKAVNRISAGRLALIAKALNKPITFFYENLEDENLSLPASQRIYLEVTRNIMKLNSVAQLKAINNLTKSMATESTAISKKREKKNTIDSLNK